jgi:hypothetical protein
VTQRDRYVRGRGASMNEAPVVPDSSSSSGSAVEQVDLRD